MTKARTRLFRIARAAGWSLVASAALYLLAGNLLLMTGLLRRATNLDPEEFVLEYDSAYTLFPGHARVKGLKARFQDSLIQFELTVDDATVRVALLELARQRFHATRVRASGVSWRMLHKVTQLEGAQKRLAAFPVIPGFEGSPFSKPPAGPPSTGEGLWTVRLDDVEAEVRELWVLEYRYQGPGHASGAFELRPLKSLWVGPARLALREGLLTAGPTVVSRNFAMNAECTITPFELPSLPGRKAFRAISASAEITALISDLAMAELYWPALTASGTGTLKAELRMIEGRLAAGSAIEASFDQLRLRAEGAGFDGVVKASARLAPDANGVEVPVGHAAAAGTIRVPIAAEPPISAVLTGAAAEVSLSTADLAEGLELDWLHGRLEEARAEDARSLTAAAAERAPIIAAAVLGSGPLTFGGTADLFRNKAVIRLVHAKLGDAALTGTAVKSGASWSGAAAGRAAGVPIGLRLTGDGLEVLPFIADDWLAQQLSVR